MTGTIFLGLLGLAVVIAFFGYTSAAKQRADAHSRPVYHALNAAIWTGLPALIFLILWLILRGPIVDFIVLAQMPDVGALSGAEKSVLISEVRQVALGNEFKEPTAAVLAAAAHLKSLQAITATAITAVCAAMAVFGAFFGLRAIAPAFRARHNVERTMTWLMLTSSVIAILTTIGIVVSLVYEAWQFFRLVPFYEFLFGTRWEPQIAIRSDQVAGQGAFGVLPVIYGTIVISFLAMLVAIPTGIMAAIYLTEYAQPKFRAVVKPLLEILAGIPTVVYGFFAVLTVAPAVRAFGQMIGLEASPNSALAAGLVMGVMIIPFVSSLSDDALAAVPQSMRDGSYALGATKGETIRKVLFPAAIPGIVGGVLLALSKAIGETMIVAMAAGLIATYAINPFESVTTVTVQIVTLLVGDAEFDNPKTLAAFALGLLLFIITLGLNLIALRTVRKYREQY
jgi:phosphate transport system permease protein